jgi:hypothetical protein
VNALPDEDQKTHEGNEAMTTKKITHAMRSKWAKKAWVTIRQNKKADAAKASKKAAKVPTKKAA